MTCFSAVLVKNMPLENKKRVNQVLLMKYHQNINLRLNLTMIKNHSFFPIKYKKNIVFCILKLMNSQNNNVKANSLKIHKQNSTRGF